MKKNKTLLLTLALTAACCSQQAFGMHLVTKGIEKAQENWKPLAYATGAVAAVTTGYVLWKKYTTQKTETPAEWLCKKEATPNKIILNDIAKTITEEKPSQINRGEIETKTVNPPHQQPEIQQETSRVQEPILNEIEKQLPVSNFTSAELKHRLQQHIIKSEIDGTLDMLAQYIAITLSTCKTMHTVWTSRETLTDSVCAKFLSGLRGGHQSTLQTFMELRKALTESIHLKEHLEQAFVTHEKINAQFTTLNCMDKNNRTRIVKQFTNIMYKEIMDKQL